MNGRIVVLLLGLAVVLVAVPAGATSGPAPSDPRALRLLANAMDAEDTVGYHGVQLVSEWASSGTESRVLETTHVPGEGTTVSVRDTAGGDGGSGFSSRSSHDVVSPLQMIGLLTSAYTLRLAGTASVAGRRTSIVQATRPDGGVAGRFWVDDEVDVVLRQEVYDGSGQLTRESAFVSFTLNPSLATHLPPLLPAPAGAAMEDVALQQWRQRGWPCPRAFGALQLVDARTTTVGGEEALHLTYTDGLSAVSVFQQPGSLDPDDSTGFEPQTVAGQRVLVHPGVPQQLVWSADGSVFTVVADGGPDVVATVVAGLPHSADDGASLRARLERGVQRVFSWVDPFG